jgi:hypothetical protein
MDIYALVDVKARARVQMSRGGARLRRNENGP